MTDADPIVYLNGEFLPIGEAKVSVLDRGFIYGDGVYEVIPVYHRAPFRMPHHLKRLQREPERHPARQPDGRRGVGRAGRATSSRGSRSTTSRSTCR